MPLIIRLPSVKEVTQSPELALLSILEDSLAMTHATLLSRYPEHQNYLDSNNVIDTTLEPLPPGVWQAKMMLFYLNHLLDCLDEYRLTICKSYPPIDKISPANF